MKRRGEALLVIVAIACVANSCQVTACLTNCYTSPSLHHSQPTHPTTIPTSHLNAYSRSSSLLPGAWPPNCHKNNSVWYGVQRQAARAKQNERVELQLQAHSCVWHQPCSRMHPAVPSQREGHYHISLQAPPPTPILASCLVTREGNEVEAVCLVLFIQRP